MDIGVWVIDKREERPILLELKKKRGPRYTYVVFHMKRLRERPSLPFVVLR